MRRAVFILCSILALPVAAQNRPADLQPLPVPPPPQMTGDAATEPQVTIIKRGQDKVEEFRMNGRLYMMKVTPPRGKPYYLIDQQGDGKWARHEGIDTGLRVPHWVVGTF
ncbi:MAG TPA: DUF2782 domain-containing protein [Rhodocyclaceae bacterium]|nr:DUF2782 domain-containing protein [Rhodocyclaceae bacterium]